MSFPFNEYALSDGGREGQQEGKDAPDLWAKAEGLISAVASERSCSGTTLSVIKRAKRRKGRVTFGRERG